MTKNELIIHRCMEPPDLAFILSTWIRGYQGGQKWFSKTPPEIFWNRYKENILRLLPLKEVKIACLKDSPDVILGYIVFKDQTIDWIYVKSDWRKMGIAKDLLPPSFDSISHLTHLAYEICFTQKKYPKVNYQPFL